MARISLSFSPSVATDSWGRLECSSNRKELFCFLSNCVHRDMGEDSKSSAHFEDITVQVTKLAKRICHCRLFCSICYSIFLPKIFKQFGGGNFSFFKANLKATKSIIVQFAAFKKVHWYNFWEEQTTKYYLINELGRETEQQHIRRLHIILVQCQKSKAFGCCSSCHFNYSWFSTKGTNVNIYMTLKYHAALL